MDYSINKNINNQQRIRESFMALAVKTFDLSFSTWYQDGYWTDKYIPYCLIDGEKVISNASVNIIDTFWNGKAKRYIQLGTIMTDPAYRNKGLSRHLINEILNDWQDKCDAIYLFANSDVVDFYPKFGFIMETEYQYSMNINAKACTAKKLDISKKEDKDLLKKYYEKNNPFSALPMLNNYELLMFYCSSQMKDCIFYCKEFDSIVIASQDNEALICFDIFCDNDSQLHDIISYVANKDIHYVVLGFTPKRQLGLTINAIDDENDRLFILKDKENIFKSNKVMFPLLSHA